MTLRTFTLVALTSTFCVSVARAPLSAAMPADPPQQAGSPSGQPPPPTASAQTAVAVEDDDAVLNPVEPDFVVVNLPTTLRLPLHKGNFRLNHRFGGNLRAGTFGEKAENLFGIDQGAIIGFDILLRGRAARAGGLRFELRFHHPEIYGKYTRCIRADRCRCCFRPSCQRKARTISAKNRTVIGVVVSRRSPVALALYATPVWVHNARLHSMRLRIPRRRMTRHIRRTRRTISSHTDGDDRRKSRHAPPAHHHTIRVASRSAWEVTCFLSLSRIQCCIPTLLSSLSAAARFETLISFNLSRKFF